MTHSLRQTESVLFRSNNYTKLKKEGKFTNNSSKDSIKYGYSWIVHSKNGIKTGKEKSQIFY